MVSVGVRLMRPAQLMRMSTLPNFSIVAASSAYDMCACVGEAKR